jgi:hypothetical protein
MVDPWMAALGAAAGILVYPNGWPSLPLLPKARGVLAAAPEPRPVGLPELLGCGITASLIALIFQCAAIRRA